ncbi:hypothetical protein GM708_10780 [Vibrio cholerae]|nr:hypothetical protein [Vibrio cholerae]
MTDRLLPVPNDDRALGVRGGVGGVRFQWEELEEASRLLAVLAADTGEVALALGSMNRELAEFPWRVMHLHAVAAVAGPLHQETLAALDAAVCSARDTSRALATTQERLTASLAAYRVADGAALAAVDAVRTVTGGSARAAARAAIDTGTLAVGPIVVHEQASGTTVPFDGTVEGVLGRLAEVESDEPGTFEVLRAGTDRRPVFVVVLPGTQVGVTDGIAGSNPFDVAGIAEALAEDSRFTEDAVLGALDAAGAREGDALIVAGYSQGGLHAVNLAASERVVGRFDLQLALTAGSPTGWHPSGESEYLHLEHRLDVVPGLDSTINGDERNRTTVTLQNPLPPLGQRTDGTSEPWGLGPAHKLENYAEGARSVDGSDAPSLAPAAALLATAGATGTARRYSFTAVRRPREADGRRPGSGVAPDSPIRLSP